MALYIIRARTDADRQACFAIRMEVFVEEQKVPTEIEMDHHDDTALHYLATLDGQAIATARVVLVEHGHTAKIGRVAVRKSCRGSGTGAAIMLAVAADPELAGVKRLMLEAQVHATGFYEKLGYTAFGHIFLDAGIPHRRMELIRG